MMSSAEEEKLGSDPNSPQMKSSPKVQEKPDEVVSPRLPKSY